MGLQVPSDLDPKVHEKTFIWNLRKYICNVLRELALQKESKIVEGNLADNCVHMLISIAPKYAGS